MLLLDDKRIRVIVGHYGSGKTEFSINYAIQLAKNCESVAIADFDIANPYFRSRESSQLLEEKGVKVYGNSFGYEITAEIPALTARAKAPLEDIACQAVVDVGGDDFGARVLMQFDKYLGGGDSDVFFVVNANRRETSTLCGVIEHVERIEKETKLKITGLINNTHMLRSTTCNDVEKGYLLCKAVSQELSVPIKYNCCIKDIVADVQEKNIGNPDFNLFPMTLYTRATWLD